MNLEEFTAEMTGMINKGPKDITSDEKIALLREYQNKTTAHKVGDLLVRNKFGEQRYSQPKTGEVAIVLDVYPHVRGDRDQASIHGVIAVCDTTNREARVIPFDVDFRCYDKVEG